MNQQRTLIPPMVQVAIVSLPSHMCERDRPLQERLVVFEGHSFERGRALEKLLATIWQVDTTGWCELGFIYNLSSARERLEGAFGDESAGDLRLFESGCGGGDDSDYWVGPDRIHYWRAADVDLFVTPRVAARLRDLLDQIEALYRAEPARRAALFRAECLVGSAA